MDISDVPDEVIFNICQTMTTAELDNFTKTNMRNYEVCKDILYKRKTTFAIEAGDVIYRYLLRKYSRKRDYAVISINSTDDFIIDNSRIGSGVRKLYNDLIDKLNKHIQKHGQFDTNGDLITIKSHIHVQFTINYDPNYKSDLLPCLKIGYLDPEELTADEDTTFEMTIREFLDYIKELILRNITIYDSFRMPGIEAGTYIRFI